MLWINALLSQWLTKFEFLQYPRITTIFNVIGKKIDLNLHPLAQCKEVGALHYFLGVTQSSIKEGDNLWIVFLSNDKIGVFWQIGIVASPWFWTKPHVLVKLNIDSWLFIWVNIS